MRSSNLFAVADRRPGRQEMVSELLEEVLKRNQTPQDRFEVAALVESIGWNDKRVAEAFGVENVFELAEELWAQIQQKIVFANFEKPEEKSKAALLLEMVQSFLRGLLFALPMAISVFTMLTLKFSLWSYEYLSVDLATVIALGTILSFLVAGGFTQAIARRGFFYLTQGYYDMSRRVTFYFIRMGYVLCAIVAVAAYAVNIIFNLLPQAMFWLFVLYFVFLTTIWLSVTVMYILRRELTFSGLIGVGILLVYALFEWLHFDILFAQLLAILLVAITGMLMSLFYFRQEAKKEEKGIAPKLPRLSMIVYSVMPYFTYGFLYFLLLNLDRIMSWSTNDEYMPFFLWFRGDYELGLDFALLAMMLPLGVSEVAVNRLLVELEASQKGFWGFETEKLNHMFLQRFNRWQIVTVVSSVISAVMVYVVLMFSNKLYYEYLGKYLLASHVTYFVLFVALAAYVVLAVALMNAVTLFALSQPKLVLRAIGPAVAIDAVVSFLLSRWVDSSWAVVGVLVGSIVFAWLSYRQIQYVMRRLDYFVYSAI